MNPRRPDRSPPSLAATQSVMFWSYLETMNTPDSRPPSDREEWAPTPKASEAWARSVTWYLPFGVGLCDGRIHPASDRGRRPVGGTAGPAAVVRHPDPVPPGAA